MGLAADGSLVPTRPRTSLRDASVGAGNAWVDVVLYRNHLLLRIGLHRFQMTKRGIRVRPYARWLAQESERFPSSEFHTIRLGIDESERRRLGDFYAALQGRDTRYSMLFQNCSQVTSRALAEAGVVPRLSRGVALLPGVAFRRILSLAESEERLLATGLWSASNAGTGDFRTTLPARASHAVH